MLRLLLFVSLSMSIDVRAGMCASLHVCWVFVFYVQVFVRMWLPACVYVTM